MMGGDPVIVDGRAPFPLHRIPGSPCVPPAFLSVFPVFSVVIRHE